jgi:hypothetical protein
VGAIPAKFRTGRGVAPAPAAQEDAAGTKVGGRKAALPCRRRGGHPKAVVHRWSDDRPANRRSSRAGETDRLFAGISHHPDHLDHPGGKTTNSRSRQASERCCPRPIGEGFITPRRRAARALSKWKELLPFPQQDMVAHRKRPTEVSQMRHGMSHLPSDRICSAR